MTETDLGEPFWQLLKRRRMVRGYLPDPIDRETIEHIVGTARRAPSAGFSQGHRLVVVTDAATRRALAVLAGEAQYVEMGHKPWISTGLSALTTGCAFPSGNPARPGSGRPPSGAGQSLR